MDEPRQNTDRENHASLPEARNPGHGESLIELQRDLENLHQRLAAIALRLLDSLPAGGGTDTPPIEPEVEIYENDQEFLFHAAMPGVDPHAIQLETTTHTVTLTAESPMLQESDLSAHPGSPLTRHRRSRYSGHMKYHFVYTLHSAISPDLARAQFRHGMVEIHLPKVRNAQHAVSIPVLLFQGAPSTHAVIGTAQISPPYEFPSVSTLPANTQEGNPSSKMGLAYVPSAGEDHAMKAQSIGEFTPSRVGRATTPQRMAASLDLPDDPAAMEANTASDKL